MGESEDGLNAKVAFTQAYISEHTKTRVVRGDVRNKHVNRLTNVARVFLT